MLNFGDISVESSVLVMIVLGLALFAGGIALNIWVERRQFYRRNIAGIEEFASYGAAVAARGLEGLARFGARLCLGVGFMMAAVALVQMVFLHR